MASTRSVKSDPRNVGKAVVFTVKRGSTVTVHRTGTILRFRGGRNASSAWIQYKNASGNPAVTCVDLFALEYTS